MWDQAPNGMYSTRCWSWAERVARTAFSLTNASPMARRRERRLHPRARHELLCYRCACEGAGEETAMAKAHLAQYRAKRDFSKTAEPSGKLAIRKAKY